MSLPSLPELALVVGRV
ncbi:hypothetical protein RDI58_025945 [Solanum bulbocastanum]|uniref:Uncharacterized protein n=1 Tax=Solanum bulbocastanum TaxID=147425 RepID=A0AAN8SS37_SOLBU